MANKHHSKMKSSGGGTNKASGSPPSAAMPMKTAACPGLPGPASKCRAAGTSTTGHSGNPFHVKKMGM